MADVNEIFDEISKQIVTLAENTVSNYRDAAIKDANDLVAAMKIDLSRWAQLLAAGQLKIDEFEFLVNTQKTLVKMKALEQAGLAELRAVQFSNTILNMIIDVVFKMVIGNLGAAKPAVNAAVANDDGAPGGNAGGN